MAKFLGLIINIIILPFALVLAIPMGILKARNVQKSRLLFTGQEQLLLGKAQRAINMEKNGAFKPDQEILKVARCIDNARVEYQIIKSRERFDLSFSDFITPKIRTCNVFDWNNVNNYFEF